jgi:hypothetical protein
MVTITVGIDRTVLAAAVVLAGLLLGVLAGVACTVAASVLRRWHMRGKRERELAAVEGELARIAMAQQGLDDLEALAMLALQRDILEDAEHVACVFDALGRVRGGLSVARKWMIYERGFV